MAIGHNDTLCPVCGMYMGLHQKPCDVEKHTSIFLEKHGIVTKKHLSYKEISSDPFYLDAKEKGNWDYSSKSKNLLVVLLRLSNYLSKKQKVCMRMHFFEGLSFNDIGKQLGISPSSVRIHIRRAIERLKKHSRKEDIEAEINKTNLAE